MNQCYTCLIGDRFLDRLILLERKHKSSYFCSDYQNQQKYKLKCQKQKERLINLSSQNSFVATMAYDVVKCCGDYTCSDYS